MAVPKEFGGLGMNLSRSRPRNAPAGAVTRRRRRSASTCTTTGSATSPTRGVPAIARCEWMLNEAEAGEMFAAGACRIRQRHSGSAVDHERRAGRRRLSLHRPEIVRQPDAGVDPARSARHGYERPGRAEIVHRFCRATRRATIKETWDVLGMRATRSDDTVLEGVFIPDRYMARVLPAGAAGADMFMLGFFTWALVGFANIYYGLALRVARGDHRTAQNQDLDRADPSDDLPSGGSARHRRDHDGARDAWSRTSTRLPATGPRAASAPIGSCGSSR